MVAALEQKNLSVLDQSNIELNRYYGKIRQHQFSFGAAQVRWAVIEQSRYGYREAMLRNGFRISAICENGKPEAP